MFLFGVLLPNFDSTIVFARCTDPGKPLLKGRITGTRTAVTTTTCYESLQISIPISSTTFAPSCRWKP